MAIDFPAGNPANSPFNAPNGVTYTWNTDGYWEAETGAGGGASVIVSDTAPGGASEGDLWYNSSEGKTRTFVWYEDVDSAQWVDASPSGGGGGDGGTGAIGNLQQVTDVGNNTTNSITIDTDKIVLNPDGSGQFWNIVVEGGITCGDDTGTKVILNSGNGVLYGYHNGDITSYLFSGGTLWLGGDTANSNPNISLGGDGNADFSGAIVSGEYDSGDVGVKLWPTGYVSIREDSGTGGLKIYNGGTSNSNVNVELASSGDGFLSNQVIVGGDPNDGVNPGVKLLSQGMVLAGRRSDNATAAVWGGFTEGTTNPTSRINADGSASFAGHVTTGTIDTTDNTTASGEKLFTDGLIRVQRPGDGSSQSCFQSWTGNKMGFQAESDGTTYIGNTAASGANTSTSNIKLNASGSATFAGYVEVEGLYSEGLITANRTDSELGGVWSGGYSGTPTSTIYASGAASFVGARFSIGGDATVRISPNADGTDPQLELKADGSATFAGNVNGGGHFLSNRVSSGLESFIGQLNGVTTTSIFADGSASFNGNNIQVRCQYSSTRGLSLYGGNASGQTPAITFDEELRFFDNGAGKGDRLVIKADGNAEFAGSVTSNGITSNGTINSKGNFQLDSTGTFGASSKATISAQDGSATFAGRKIIYNADGSANFDGRVDSADGFKSTGDYGFNSFTDSTGPIFVANNSAGNAPKVVINGDGSAAFSGTVTGNSITNTVVQSDAPAFIANAASTADTHAGYYARQFTAGGYTYAGAAPNGVVTFSVKDDGSATFAGTINGATVGTSDEKFKENITPASSQLSDVVALGGMLKNFDWNDDAPVNESIRSTRHLGLVAQQVEAVCPSLVKTLGGEDDSHKGISHDALIMKLLGAVKELDALRPTHVSFDGSGGDDFDFSTAKIASHNVASVERTAKGMYTITFTNAFASDKYTAVATAGDENHSGTGASPRCVNVVARTATTLDIVVERSDDAVQDDDGYIAVFIAA